MAWLMVALAITSEILATSFLVTTKGFTQPLPTAGVLLGYAVSFLALAKAVQQLELGVVYAIWSGVGTAVIAVIGVMFLGESATVQKITALLFIVVGVVILNLEANPSPQ